LQALEKVKLSEEPSKAGLYFILFYSLLITGTNIFGVVGIPFPQAGLEVDGLTFRKLAEAFARAGQWPMAEAVLRKMEAAGQAVRGQRMMAFNALVATCGAGGEWERAEGLLASMGEAGVQPNAVTYAVLLGAAGRAGQVSGVDSGPQGVDSGPYGVDSGPQGVDLGPQGVDAGPQGVVPFRSPILCAGCLDARPVGVIH
jgi:pentatricopeptide repeat protein